MEIKTNHFERNTMFTDIQGEYIPKLVWCCGYYEDRMCYVIGTTLVGTGSSKIGQQRTRGLCALKAINDKDVLHPDIRGMASYDVEINSKSFKEEETNWITCF